jgi:CheY-like chemotaxis protein
VILVVDDQEDKRLVLRDYLNAVYEIIDARYGEEAIRVAETTLPHLISMDLRLPRMNGVEATQRIKANAALGRAPVIKVTSFALSSDERQALDADCVDYLAKPGDPALLLEKIGACLP